MDAEAREHPPVLPHPAEHKDLRQEVLLRHDPTL